MKIALVHQGWPAGSFVTTRGLERAFRRREDVETTIRISADELESLPSDLDFVFVEGFPGKKRWQTLQTLRPPKLFWWLSTNFGRMSPDLLVDSNLAHVFTNSDWGVAQLEGRKPVTFLPLAFDREMADHAVPADKYSCEVAYLGISGHKSRAQLRTMLDPAADFDFKLWGKGWNWTRYRSHHQGLLPAGDIPALYASAGVVIGMTELKQQALGMINNRVFEALGCGAAFVTDHFPELESFLGEYAYYSHNPAETTAAITELLGDPEKYRDRRRAGQQWILKNHTYDLRAEAVVRVFRDLN